MTGLSEEDADSSLDTLYETARRLGATVQILTQRRIETRPVADILVRKVPDDRQTIDLSACVSCVLGSADVGKSTLLGVLTQEELDNVRRRARLNLLRHLHEIQSDRTSSISHNVHVKQNIAKEICENSSKLITFIDLAGYQKHMKTTISALTGYCPHHSWILELSSLSYLICNLRLPGRQWSTH